MPLPARRRVQPHDHAIYIYDDETDLLDSLGKFVRDRVDEKELATFVHALQGHDAGLAFAARAHREARTLASEKRLAVSHCVDAFEGGAGRIDDEHVGRVVGSLKSGAREAGLRGVGVFVDASRRYLEEGRRDEWFAFESRLGSRLAADIGLVCAYRKKDLAAPGMLKHALDAHAYRFAPESATA